jgi:hypothetical protein
LPFCSSSSSSSSSSTQQQQQHTASSSRGSQGGQGGSFSTDSQQGNAPAHAGGPMSHTNRPCSKTQPKHSGPSCMLLKQQELDVNDMILHPACTHIARTTSAV